MNPLRPPSTKSRQVTAGQGKSVMGTAWQGRGAPAAALAGRFGSVTGAAAARSDDGSQAAGGDVGSQAAGEPAVVAAATSPTLPSLQASNFPAWWTSSSPMGSSEGIYPPRGFTDILNSNITEENFHLVGNTRGSNTISPNAPSLKRTRPNAPIVVEADETNEDERTERRLNYRKDEDIRLASAWLRKSKDPVDGTDRSGDQFWADVTEEYNKGTEVNRRRRPLFLRIVGALGEWSPFFTLRYDALNRPGLSPIQKCTAAIRQLANGSPADQLDEYIKIGESTAIECLKLFVEGVIAKFGEEYLRRPTVQDVERLMAIGERRGFPGMLGSIDCMHWHWEKYPYGWKGMYTRGDHGVPTIILEAVAGHDRWIWHAFFGVAGSNNDINVLSQSDLFVEYLRGENPKVQYYINGREYNMGYYLGDGIYPEWPAFVKSIKRPQIDEHKLFSQKQEEARKDVECSFGILQSRWCILRRPARLFEQGDLQNVILACIILHNMIIEDENDIEQVPFDLNEEGSTYTVEEATITHGENPELEEVLDRRTALHDRLAHRQLQSDLIEHIWQKFGNSYRQNN